MTYDPTLWQSGAQGNTLVSAQRLNKLEGGVKSAHDAIAALGGGTGTPAVPATILGVINKGATVQATTMDTSAVGIGEWMLVGIVSDSVNATNDFITPDGWTVVKASWAMGTRRAVVFGKIKTEADGSSSVFSKVLQAGTFRLALAHGVVGSKPISEFVAGAVGLRASASVPINPAPPVQVVKPGSLVVTFSFEATSAEETGITSVTGSSSYFFGAQNSDGPAGVIETIWVGTRLYDAAGMTTQVNVTYPNAAGSPNGSAIQIVIPPAVDGVEGGTPGTGDVTTEQLNAAIATRAPMSHTHAISDVTNLQSSLNAKASTAQLPFAVNSWTEIPAGTPVGTLVALRKAV